jgi:hypothetical protein
MLRAKLHTKDLAIADYTTGFEMFSAPGSPRPDKSQYYVEKGIAP